MLPSEVCSPGADHTPQVIWAAISTSAQPQVRGGDERLDRVAGLLERGPTSFLSVHDGQDAEDPSALGGDCGNGLRCRVPVVITSSTTTTAAPGLKQPSMRFPVPWALACLRTLKASRAIPRARAAAATA